MNIMLLLPYLEKIFFYSGSAISIILGFLKIKDWVSGPKVKMKPNIKIKSIAKNSNGSEEMVINCDITLINKGKEVYGRLIINGYENFFKPITDYIILKKGDSPLRLEKDLVFVASGNIGKWLKSSEQAKQPGKFTSPIIADVYFQDDDGKPHAKHKLMLDFISLGNKSTLL